MPESPTTLLIQMFHNISAAIDRERDHLSELDGAIGDADHGITMSIGFQAVTMELGKQRSEQLLPHEIMTLAAKAFLDAVGASSGPLYASGLKEAARVLKDRGLLDLVGQATMLSAIAKGISDRGKAQQGDKTMIDVWMPARDAAEAALKEGADADGFWRNILDAARSGALDTKSMVAAKGRAVRLGDRSLGHEDPGAASATTILEAMAETFCTTGRFGPAKS